MELLTFVLSTCAITAICGLLCWREKGRIERRAMEQHRAGLLMVAVQKMPGYAPQNRSARHQNSGLEAVEISN